MNSNNYLNDLDNLLDDLSYAKVNLPCHYSHLSSDTNCHHQTANRNQINQNSYSSPQKSRARTGSQQVNELIKNLEQNLHFPNEARNMTGKPIHLNHKYDNEYMNLMDLKPSPTRAQLTPSAHQHQHQYQHQHSIVTPQSTASVNSSPKRVVINNNVQHVNHVHNHPTAASCATRELDDLMASLNDFKMKERSANTAANSVTDYAKVHGPSKVTMVTQPQHLDSIIGNLQSDMIRHGVDTTAKGHCHACHKPIVGQVVTALGKTWHPEHFTCVHCGSELGTKNFFERDSEPYCETDYHNLFSPRCAYCNASILDKCITALDKTWHPEHFFCAHCGKSFGDDGYHDKDGKPYCRNDYFELFAPKCGGCATSITDNYISALNTQWHPECFVCRDCRTPFNGGHFFDHEGQPYCEVHYHAHRGSLCAGCHKPITGRCITAMYRKFHPEHFVCSFCLKQLNKGTFKEQNDKPYCHNCFEKLFA